MKRSLVGKKVIVTNEAEPELKGEIGTVIGVIGWHHNQIIYKVEFGFDVGKLTRGKEPGNDIGLLASWIEEFEMDYEFLINEALRTGDKAWFHELIAQKEKGRYTHELFQR